MKKEIYRRGIPGKKYGIWNTRKNGWEFGICEDTPMLANARLHQRIGEAAKDRQYEPRILPDRKTGHNGLVKALRTYADEYRSGKTLGRAIVETEDRMDEAADVIEELERRISGYEQG